MKLPTSKNKYTASVKTRKTFNEIALHNLIVFLPENCVVV